MKYFVFIVAAVFLITSANAQIINSSPFKHLPVPQKSELLKAGLSNEVTAYRFMLPFAGYSPVTKQISTGIGYGWNRLHYVDSAHTYYTDVSIFGAIFVNGDLAPSPYNFTSIGIGVAAFNGLIMIVPAYNLPTSEKKSGAFDLKLSFGLTLK